MAVDLQIVMPQESIQINGISIVAGSNPTVLDILGQDFSAVDEVLINEVVASTYFIISKNRMFVTLPTLVAPNNIQSVAVTSRRLVMTAQSMLKFQISRVPSKVSGILRLVQLFIRTLFTTPGTDIFNQRGGAGALRDLGRTFGKTQSGAIVSNFVVAVDNTTRQITARQGRQPQLPPDEKLLTARVTTARFSVEDSALVVSVEVTSQTGRAATANVVM